MEEQYVDLLANGRLFPTWILANFKQYKLQDIFKTNIDACASKTSGDKKTAKEWRKYQLFVSKFLDYRSVYKDILIYHGLGSGKTATAINVYNVLYNSNPGWNIFLLIKAGLHATWLKELKDWLSKDEYEFRMRNIIFVHYDSPFANKSFLEAVQNADSSKKNMYIIDECHNFIRNVYSNISTSKGRRAQEIYDYIIQDKKDNESTRVVLLSGTPAINSPYELALLFNLLRPNAFPKSETLFNQTFVNSSTGEINLANKNMFQRRIMGLVSYYIGATPDFYATQQTKYIDVAMSEYQKKVYKFFEKIEAAAMQRSKGQSENYRTYTRQACNFVFPHVNHDVIGELRPRPSKFRISEREAEKLAEGRKLKTDAKTESITDIQGYFMALENYVKSLEIYFDNFNENDVKNKYTIQDDLKKFKEVYDYDYEKFRKDERHKSSLYNAMYEASPKMLCMIFIAMTSPGNTMIYSNYVIMEGLQIIKIYLKYFGFTSYGTEVGKDYFRYIEYSGNILKELREANKDRFNEPENKYGKIIKIFLLSPAAAEGLSLFNVRQVHIFEPYWHEVRILQMIGRGIRQCSHKDLPMNERHVDIFRYKTISDGITTADQYVEGKAKLRDKLINSFLSTIKEVSIDCNLNYAHNKIQHDIKCFQFEEPSLLTKQVGPAFKKDILDDAEINNGSNSMKAKTIKIKVKKIEAVKKLGENKYSKHEKYWYNPETNVVYEYDLKYPLGKIALDNDNIPIKIEQKYYVIDKVIPIPIIKN